jgi:hypothetical protein
MKPAGAVQEVVNVDDGRPRCRRVHYNFEVHPNFAEIWCKACGSTFRFGRDVIVKETILRRPRPRPVPA